MRKSITSKKILKLKTFGVKSLGLKIFCRRTFRSIRVFGLFALIFTCSSSIPQARAAGGSGLGTGAAQSVLDGLLSYKESGSATMTIEGDTAKVFFTNIPDTRITSSQPTDSCKAVVVKSGDNMECSHCEEKEPSPNSDSVTYWCTLEINTKLGKVLENPTFTGGKK